MESIQFRCESCATLLNVPSENVSHTVRCNGCGAVVIVPSSGDTYEMVREPKAVPATRPQQENHRNRSADMRSAPGWRKVRLGLILIAVSMCTAVLGGVASIAGIPGWDLVQWVLQALPLAGNLLCAFVPLKGPARNLTLANLAVIAAGLALTFVVERMAGGELAELEQSTARIRIEEINKKLIAIKPGDADALQLVLAELEAASADLTAASSRSLSSMERFAELMRTSAQWSLLRWCIQIIILSFFIQAIARALRAKQLAANCPRLALLTLVTMCLLLLANLPLPNVWLVLWITYPLGLVSFIWQGLLLTEACAAIGNHLRAGSGPPR